MRLLGPFESQVENHWYILWPGSTFYLSSSVNLLTTHLCTSTLYLVENKSHKLSCRWAKSIQVYDFELGPESENCFPSTLCPRGRAVTLESLCGHCCLQRACWPCEPSPPLKQTSLIACRNWSWHSTSWWDITAPNLPHSSAVLFLSSSPHHCVSVTALPAGQTEEAHSEPKRIGAGSFPLWPSGAGKSLSDFR